MLCPKCKKEIENHSLKCKYCKTKIGSVCKDCGTYNLITATECAKCGKVLLKICTECGAANLPEASSCRKCNIEFTKEPLSVDNSFTYVASMNSQQKIKQKLIEAINDIEPKIIALNGESGSGKSLVLKHAINEFKSAKLIWLLGTCTHLTQLSRFAFKFFQYQQFLPKHIAIQEKFNQVL